MSLELLVALWGAGVATVLAVLEIVRARGDRPRITVEANLILSTSSEGAETHGVLIQVQHSDQLHWEEADVEMEVVNRGRAPIQIVSAYVETRRHVHQIVPAGFPVVLDPSTRQSVRVQPEIVAPLTVPHEAVGKIEAAPLEVLSVGVIDALGEKHPMPISKMADLVGRCRSLPLRTEVYRHKPTGSFVTAFQASDPTTLVSKGSGHSLGQSVQRGARDELPVVVSRQPPP